MMMAEIKMTHVPYKGTGASLIDVIAGQVQLTISPIPAVRPHLLAGLLRRDVEDLRAEVGPAGGDLEQERGLADPGLSTQEIETPRYDPAAQEPVELGGPGRDPLGLRRVHLGQRPRGRRRHRPLPARRRALQQLLDQGVPLPALRTPSRPAQRGSAAGRADEPGAGARRHTVAKRGSKSSNRMKLPSHVRRILSVGPFRFFPTITSTVLALVSGFLSSEGFSL